MTGKLLWRGMLAGLVAAVLSFSFLKIAGEPAVEHAITFEKTLDDAKAKAEAVEAAAKGRPAPHEEAEPELVDRRVQSGIGLLTGVGVYSIALGGLFALAFTLVFRRMGDFSPRATAAWLAVTGFVGVYVTPMLKYPANPPSVGLPETISMRTSLYFAMILISLAAMIAAGILRVRISRHLGDWNAALICTASYIVVVAAVALAMPDVNEVPEGFPSAVLWQFRVASLGSQAIMWATLGLLFGALAERTLVSPRPSLRPTAP
jgi:predicted cobalt transporter CbtA